MSTIDDFAKLIETTDVVKEALRRLKEEPALLLGTICREYQRTGKPVSDHHLQLHGYMSEVALMALLSAGLVRRQPGGRTSLYCYEPTTKGTPQYEKLKAGDFYAK